MNHLFLDRFNPIIVRNQDKNFSKDTDSTARFFNIITNNTIKPIYYYSCSNHNNFSNYYCSCSHDKNFSNDTDSTTIGIELCKIPHISEH
jgi:hypothetical protein